MCDARAAELPAGHRASRPPDEAAPTAEQPQAAAEPSAAEPAAAEEPPAAKPIRRFVQVEGEVTLDGEPAAVDMELPNEATITTGKSGHAVITLEPGGIVEIRKDTRLRLGSSERKKNSLELLAGAIWNFLPKGTSHEVVTPNAVAGVRGSIYYVEVHGPRESYICACDGEFEIQTADKKALNKSVPSKAEHKAFRIRTKGKRQRVRRVKRARHTDDQKMALMPLQEQTAQ